MDKVALRTGGIAVIGFGEAARAFVAGWQTVSAGPYRAFDIQLDAPATRPAMTRTMQEAKRRSKTSLVGAGRPDEGAVPRSCR